MPVAALALDDARDDQTLHRYADGVMRASYQCDEFRRDGLPVAGEMRDHQIARWDAMVWPWLALAAVAARG